MRTFILIAIGIFALGNTYMFIRSWQALELLGRFRVWYAVLFWMVALLFIAINLVRVPGSGWLDALHTVASTWVAVMLYAFLLLLLIDIFRMAGWLTGIRPVFIYAHYKEAKLVLFAVTLLVIVGIFVFGYRSARFPEITRLEIPVAGKTTVMRELRVVMASDLHLGHTAGRKFLSRVVDRINELDADVVLLAGDTFDGDPEPVIRKDMGTEFDRMKTRYGIYAIGGNHERIGERFGRGNARRAFDYLASHGITVLLDSVTLVNHAFFIAGRKDYSANSRESLDKLLAPVREKPNLPVILLDHQPFHLEEAQHAGVDLQLSGHTHYGQMFPINLITSKIYEQDWGYLQKGNTHYYVSCGAGTWGPVLRTAGHSEIVFIRLIF
jgi:predicted MPP superfamily phosphohydrolase